MDKKLLEDWKKYCKGVDDENHEIRNRNIVRENEAKGSGREYEAAIRKHEERFQKWLKRPFWKFPTEPPMVPPAPLDKIHEIDHAVERQIYPDFAGFMNYLLSEQTINKESK